MKAIVKYKITQSKQYKTKQKKVNTVLIVDINE